MFDRDLSGNIAFQIYVCADLSVRVDKMDKIDELVLVEGEDIHFEILLGGIKYKGGHLWKMYRALIPNWF